MHLEHVDIVISYSRRKDEEFTEEGYSYFLSDEAESRIAKILHNYNQYRLWYMSALERSSEIPFWAMVFFDREYAIAGHVKTTRSSPDKISFSPYVLTPEEVSGQYIPKVGVLLIREKLALISSSSNSPIFKSIHEQLKDCDEHQHWVLFMDALNADLLKRILPGDDQLWLMDNN